MSSTSWMLSDHAREALLSYVPNVDKRARIRNYIAAQAEQLEKAEAGDWYCPGCQEYLGASRVTNDEKCDTCGTAVLWVAAQTPEAVKALKVERDAQAERVAELEKMLDLAQRHRSELLAAVAPFTVVGEELRNYEGGYRVPWHTLLRHPTVGHYTRIYAVAGRINAALDRKGATDA